MIQNFFIFALLFVSSGVYGSTVTESYKPKAKDAHAVRKMNQNLFHKNIQAKHKAPLADIKAGKVKAVQSDPAKFAKAKTVVAAKAGALRGAAVATESLTTAKTRLLSPNKGFIESTLYDDALCSSPTSNYGTAVNYCYYDEDTEGATADVVLIKKFTGGYSDIVVNSFVFTDSSCTSLNTTASSEELNTQKSYCYTFSNFSTGEFYFAYNFDHVTTPINVTTDTTFSYYEYKTEAACNNWNVNGIASYGSLVADEFGCNEYFNDGEYFKFTCVDSAVEAQVYSDDTCTTYLRNTAFGDMCSTDYLTYPTRVVCETSTD